MKYHKFDMEDAIKFGVGKAILLEHLKRLQETNADSPEKLIHGKPYFSMKPDMIERTYPYLSYKTVSRWLNELEDEGVLESQKPMAREGDHLKYYHVISYK